MSVRHVRLPEGERTVLLAPSLIEMPDLWVAGYVATELRSSSVHDNTARNALLGIQKGLAFFKARTAQDLRERALRLEFDSNELAAFAAFCRRRIGGGAPIKQPSAPYASFIAFFIWLGEEPTAQPPLERRERLLAKTDLLSRAKLHKPRDDPGGGDEARLGLDQCQRDLFLRVIIPVAEDNPFYAAAFRNFVIMTLAWSLGLRSGEILGLKVQDIDFRLREVTIHRRHDDPDDKRRRPAAQKTEPRTLAISERLAAMLRELAKEGRSARAEKKHPYLFLNRYGEPLGQGGLGKAYRRLREAHPSLCSLVNHVLRHTWNDRWQEMVKKESYDPDRSIDEQNYAQGWTIASRMPLEYTRRHRRENARARLLKMQGEQ